MVSLMTDGEKEDIGCVIAMRRLHGKARWAQDGKEKLRQEEIKGRGGNIDSIWNQDNVDMPFIEFQGDGDTTSAKEWSGITINAF